MKKYIIIIAFLIPILQSCGGLEPIPAEQKTLIKGTINFVDDNENWPPQDSIFDMRVIAFKNYPPADLIGDIINGLAYYTNDSLPLYQKSVDFQIEITDPPQTLEYIVVAYQYGSIMEWKAAGVFSLDNDPRKPTAIATERGKQYSILINVDFKHLPPQPGEW